MGPRGTGRFRRVVSCAAGGGWARWRKRVTAGDPVAIHTDRVAAPSVTEGHGRSRRSPESHAHAVVASEAVRDHRSSAVLEARRCCAHDARRTAVVGDAPWSRFEPDGP